METFSVEFARFGNEFHKAFGIGIGQFVRKQGLVVARKLAEVALTRGVARSFRRSRKGGLIVDWDERMLIQYAIEKLGQPATAIVPLDSRNPDRQNPAVNPISHSAELLRNRRTQISRRNRRGDQFYARTDYFTKTEVVNRGWTVDQIERFLGHPDLRFPRYRFRTTAMMYHATRVKAMERSPSLLALNPQIRSRLMPEQGTSIMWNPLIPLMYLRVPSIGMVIAEMMTPVSPDIATLRTTICSHVSDKGRQPSSKECNNIEAYVRTKLAAHNSDVLSIDEATK